MNELCFLTAHAAIARFREQSLSPVELVGAVLDQATRMAPRINATTAIHADAALAAARAAEQRYHDGTARPLEGIPVAIKEEHTVSGWRKTNGSWLWDEQASHHHPIVDKLLRAGAIPHLQTTVPEFCLIGQTWSKRYGTTRNPWNPAMTPGGSSGGTGAALAAGLAPLGTGSDMGGSIRIPAAQCGLYGFKPPHGRNPCVAGEELFAFAVDGPMARSLDDLILMQNVIAGPHPDTYVAIPSAPLPDRFEPVRGLRIGLSFTTGSPAIDPDIRRNMEAAGAALEAAGAIIEPVELAWDAADLGDRLLDAIFGIFFAEFVESLPAARLAEGTTYLHWLLERYGGRRNSIMGAAEAAVRLHAELQAKLWGRGVSALLCPTVFTADVPADLDLSVTRSVDVAGHPVDSYLGWVGTLPFNLLSRYPALAVPTGLGQSGVPTSVQVVAAPFADATAFRIAAQIDERLDTGLFQRRFPATVMTS